MGSLLVPYPQYGGLYEMGVLGARERYHSVELKAQKAFSKGYNFLVSYVYIREKTQTNGFLNGSTFNDLDAYQNNLDYQNSNQPHHRFNIASTWELPFGKGRAFLNATPRPWMRSSEAGRWPVFPLSYPGDYPQFGNLIVTGSPCVSNPTPQHWFNTVRVRAHPGEYLRATDQSLAIRLPDGTEILEPGCESHQGVQHH